MNDVSRYIVAGILIFLILFLSEPYLSWLGVNTHPSSVRVDEVDLIQEGLGAMWEKNNYSSENLNHSNSRKVEVTPPSTQISEELITIKTPLYTSVISNRSGGSFDSFKINGAQSNSSKYMGSYSPEGLYSSSDPVSLILPSEKHCRPCLHTAALGDITEPFIFINDNLNFNRITNTLEVAAGEIDSLRFQLLDENGFPVVSKTLIIHGDSFLTTHTFSINNSIYPDDPEKNLELFWIGGTRPTEERLEEDAQYASSLVGRPDGGVEDHFIKPDSPPLPRDIDSGLTGWVGVRSKYFISAILTDTPAAYNIRFSENILFSKNNKDGGISVPSYSVGMGFGGGPTYISSDLYLGPLDVDALAVAPELDAAMNWGFSLIKPISKGVLWLLKFVHRTFNLNYGIVLLLFAGMVRLITGPLTKKSFESSQNMQKIQPELKKVQEKHKGNPQALNKDTMALYKKHGVNPLGGCLPILLQMPLLFALFQVFRTTIEFRGAPFILWINDLSKPDVVFDLGFHVPIYGSGVAILPLIMGATLVLTMRMTSAAMDPSQKPVMYIMNGFFVLLFNTFPSGLNLYYTAYNILSFFQQRSIRSNLNK